MKTQVGAFDGSDDDFKAERTRLTRARANKVELEVSEKSKELIPLETVEREWFKIASAIKNRLLSIPNALAPELSLLSDASEIEDVLTKAIDDALSELSRGSLL